MLGGQCRTYQRVRIQIRANLDVAKRSVHHGGSNFGGMHVCIAIVMPAKKLAMNDSLDVSDHVSCRVDKRSGGKESARRIEDFRPKGSCRPQLEPVAGSQVLVNRRCRKPTLRVGAV